jgi:Fe-S-cluster-containing hydrogenase component 2
MFKLTTRLCTACRLCMLSCTSAHQPDMQGIKMARLHIADTWPDKTTIEVCIACKDKPCIAACPEEALCWDDHVVLDEARCTSCGECVSACPVNGVQVHPADGHPLICDTCAGQYTCVQTCPTGALARR